MGTNARVFPGSRLTTNLASGGTSITVADAGATGLNWALTDDVRVVGKQAAVCNAQVPPVAFDMDGAGASIDTNTINGLGAAASAALTGSVVANLNATNQLVENVDYVIDYSGGAIRFNSSVDVTPEIGNTYAFLYRYLRSDAVEVRLGKFKPVLEVSVRLEHTFPDGRKVTYTAPRAMVKPENPTLSFQDDDWIGTDLEIEILESNDPQDVDAPFGKFRIDTKNGVSLEGYNPDTYSSGTFNLYLTPLDSNVALLHGFTGSEIDVGNVAVGDIQANREFLKHYRGVPKKTDKVIEIQKEMSITATIENLNPTNFALLFEGERVEDITGATWQEDAVLVTIPDVTDPEVAARWIPVPQLRLDPS